MKTLSPMLKICLSLIALIGLELTLLNNTSYAETKDENQNQNQPVLNESDRQGLLTAINDNVMQAMFTELASASITLTQSTATFCETKTKESLTEVQKSWSATSYAWQQVDSLLFGPSIDENIDFTIYFLPIKKGIVKELLAKDALLKADIDSAGVGAQGLGALEYLLFSREESFSDIHQSYVADNKRCVYLTQAAELLNDNIRTISKEWQHYGRQFALAGKNSLFFLESGEAMSELINKLYQSAQKISVKKLSLLDLLGSGSGKKISAATPYKLHAWRSGDSLKQIKANVVGIKRILNDGDIIQWLKANKNVKLADDLSQVINEIERFNIIDNDLFNAIQKAPNDLQSLVLNSQKLTQLIKTELAPSLGVQLGFNDNDGD